MKIGSLCSGYEGLAMGVRAVLGGELAWVADNDPGAAKILAHHFPDVPNHGDLTETDWSAVEPVGIVTAGWPCPPVSQAGRRKGIHDERWLFDDICAAVGRMGPRPGMLVLENVPGLLSANGGDAMARVVHGLAALGYEHSYRLVRASDAGAPHRRERWFCVAWLAAVTEREPVRVPARGFSAAPGAAEKPRAERQRLRADDSDGGSPAQDPDRPASGERRFPGSGQAPGGRPRADAGGPGGTRVAADAAGTRPARAEDPGSGGGDESPRAWGVEPQRGGGRAPADTDRGGFPELAERDRWPYAGIGGALRDDAERRGEAAADPDSPAGRRHQPGTGPVPLQGAAVLEWPPQQPGRLHSGSGDAGALAVEWGAYEPAIHRWESILGRPAPRPTEPGRTGDRLSPAFVEWMMGLPEGWVTGVPGLSRNAQLKALGNGCVPQQVELALRSLLGAVAEAA